MENQELKNLKKLSALMEKELRECHERELMNIVPIPAALTQVTKGLIRRRLFRIKPYVSENKTYDIFYVTGLGMYYLEKNAVLK
jgi:hypothetical protein